MSRYTAERVAQDVNNVPAYIGPMIFGADGASAHTDGTRGLNAIRLLAEANPETEITSALQRRGEILSAYGFGVPASVPDKPFVFMDGAAIIPIHGMLINRFPYSWGFVTGYNFIRDQVALASADDDVKLIVYDVNTYGGTVPGCEETAQIMFDSRTSKPSIAVVDSSCFSAGMYLAAQASKVVVTPSGNVGGIGCIALRLDVSGMYDQAGIKITMIHAGAFKTDGYPYAPMSDGEKARAQASVDAAYDVFVSAVARGRGISEDAVRATEAGCYNAPEALRIGLVDGIVAPAAAVRDALCPPDDDEDDDPDNPDDDEDTMTSKPDATQASGGTPATLSAADMALAASTARTEERTRITGILGCDEAKGKQTLANHIATETSMTVDEAKALLVKSAPEVSAEGNPLETAMNQNGSPGVGTGDGAGGAPGATDAVSRILAAQEMATGRKVKVAA